MILPTDPQAGYLAYKSEIDAAITHVMNSGWYILGTEVEKFEEEFATFIGADYAVGVANGTDAVMLALKAIGVGPGDAVLTVSHTAVATVAAVEMAGATPVLVDIDPRTFTMCPDSLMKAINDAGSMASSLKAIVPVHLYGQPCNMAAIMDIARQHGLRIVEDCSQSHGAAFGQQITGAIGDVAAFSLYPTKNLGAFGDAGIITTNDPVFAERIRLLRQYGWRERNRSEVAGVNSRLDEVQAAILRVKLTHLREMNAARQSIAEIYDAGLRDLGTTPFRISEGTHVFHQYVIRVPHRDALKRHLYTAGVGTMIHYPNPVHTQSAYAGRLRNVVDLCHTERAVDEILSLPIYPELPIEAALKVVESIARFPHDSVDLS